MENTIKGKVYLNKGGSIILDSTEKQLDAVLNQFYPAGTVLEITLAVKPIGKVEFCKAPSKWFGTCDHRTSGLGDCPNEANHATEEELAEREAKRNTAK